MPRQVTTLPVTEIPVADGNWDTNRDSVIDTIVIHTTVGTEKDAASRFDNPASKVSAHYIVDVDGEIYHCVDEDKVAYHAGQYVMNQRSIGIEHADNGDYNGVRPDSLYTASAELVADICKYYQIPIDRAHIIKHSEVIATGCPDALDIDRIVKMAQAIAGEVQVMVDSSTFQKLVHNSSVSDSTNDYLGLPHNSDFSSIKLRLDALQEAAKKPDVVITPAQNSQNSTPTVPVPSNLPVTETSVPQPIPTTENSQSVTINKTDLISKILSFLGIK